MMFECNSRCCGRVMQIWKVVGDKPNTRLRKRKRNKYINITDK